MYVKFLEMINVLSKYLTDKKQKMSSFFLNKRRQRGQNFQIFKGPFLRNEWPYGYDVLNVFRDLCEASKK